MHFFLPFSQGYLEIRAATVHESVDGARKDTPQGFFFAGRLWNDETLKSFAGDTDNHFKFLPAIPPAHEATTEDDADNGIISFTRTLSGWDDRPVTRILICNDSGPQRRTQPLHPPAPRAARRLRAGAAAVADGLC